MMKKALICLLLVSYAKILHAQNSYYIEKTSCGSAIQYNDYLVDLIALVDDQWTLAIEDSIMESALAHSKKMNEISGMVLKTLDKLKVYKGGDNFKNTAIAYVQHMNKISKKELPEFIKLIRNPDKFTTAMEKRAEKLIPILDDKRESLFAEIENAQQQFARQHGFTVN